MPTIWVVSEQRSLSETLAHHLRGLGEVRTGSAEPGAWKDADSPDLVVLVAAESAEWLAELERALDFLGRVPRRRRAPQPVAYIEPASGGPGAELVRELIDDRTLRILGWPLEPDALLAAAADLLAEPSRPASLRERARRAWVTRRVELFYAGIELPALRQSVDPRSAHRPVLLAGEPGTGRGILARYIHQLAEPARDELVLVPAASVGPETERELLERSAGRRVTVHLENIDRVDREGQERLLALLGAGGMLELEPVRWVASVSQPRALIPHLRQLPWIRVELPPLRARGDLEALARGLAALWAERAGRPAELDPGALAALGDYAWPGNLRELEAVVDATLARAEGPVASAQDVGLGLVPPPAPPERGGEPHPRPEPARDDPGQPVPGEPGEVRARHIGEPKLGDVIPPLAQEIREPMLAIRTYANLLDQRPNDSAVRREFSRLVEHDLTQLEDTINRLERFAGLKPGRARPFDVAAAFESELELRADLIREIEAQLQVELEHGAPGARADEEHVRLAFGMLLDRALRMLPQGGELYVGSVCHPASTARPPHHRILLRFHSPEEVLIAPEDGPGPSQPLEVVLARALIQGQGGSFAVDVSGTQDNVILIELPA